MLQHVSIEIAADQAEAALEFFGLIGFDRVEAPEEIAPYVTWVERAGTQFHLILIEGEGATVPPLGHAAVVVDDFDGHRGRASRGRAHGRGVAAALGRGAGVRDHARRPPRRADGRAAALLTARLSSSNSIPLPAPRAVVS